MRYQRINDLLRKNFAHLVGLVIEDESHQHAGRQGEESHFKILLISDEFLGLSRVARQRKINAVLADEFHSGLHALSLRLLTVEESQRQSSPFLSPNCQGKN